MDGSARPKLFADIEIIDRPEVTLIDELAAYWDRKRGKRTAPSRADIDPSEIPAHLPHIVMVDVLEAGADFRYRLIGTSIVHGIGRDNTGKRLTDLYDEQPDARAQLRAYFKLGVDTRGPVFSRGRVFWMPDAGYRRFASCLLPLSNDGTNVNILLAELFIGPNPALKTASSFLTGGLDPLER